MAGDLEDFHPYKAIPDHADEWDEWVDEFAEPQQRLDLVLPTTATNAAPTCR